jgi:quercetin dioxygenase-like cupin family protein
MTAFSHVDDLEVLQIWDGLIGRAAVGKEASLVFIEIEPNMNVPEHQHPNEQTGLLIRGSMTFTVGDETKELKPGAMWVIPGNTPHCVASGPEGSVLVELFAPPRDDWGGLERKPARPVTLS